MQSTRDRRSTTRVRRNRALNRPWLIGGSCWLRPAVSAGPWRDRRRRYGPGLFCAGDGFDNKGAVGNQEGRDHNVST